MCKQSDINTIIKYFQDRVSGEPKPLPDSSVIISGHTTVLNIAKAVDSLLETVIEHRKDLGAYEAYFSKLQWIKYYLETNDL